MSRVETLSSNLARCSSQSAPALLALDELAYKTNVLNQRVSTLRESLRAPSLSFSLPNSPLKVSVMDPGKKGTCHACHAPLSMHSQVPSGLNRCPLEHYEGCPGGFVDGKAANGSEWRGCPSGFVPGSRSPPCRSVGSDNQDEVFTNVENKSGELLRGDSLSNSNLSGENLESDIIEEHSDETKQLQEAQERNKLLKEQLEAQRQHVERQEQSRLLQNLEAENQRLLQQMSGDFGGARSKQQHQGVPQSSILPRGSRSTPRPTNGTTEKGTAHVSWHASYQQHLNKNQAKGAQPTSTGTTAYTGLDINGIRKIPGLRHNVENLVGQVQDLVPSLDKRPSAGAATCRTQLLKSKPTFTPYEQERFIGQTENRQGSPKVDDGSDFVYLRRPNGTIYRVPIVNEDSVATLSPMGRVLQGSQQKNTSHLGMQEDPLVSSDDECPLVPRNGYKHVWRRDRYGEKYFTEERIPTMAQHEWVKDPQTGRTYKKRVSATPDNPEVELRTVIDPATGNEVEMFVPTTILATKPKHNDKYTAPPVEKQGRDDKLPNLVEFARNCPVAWTSKITGDKLNMGLWCWAYIAQLLASRKGSAPALQRGELEARMQHFLNVLEVALQPSNSAEYDGPSWKVARLYAEKVQQKVDKGSSWAVFEQRYGTDTHPHELMAAQTELAPKLKPKDPKELKKPKEGKEKPTCTTWNSSEVENKCKYEVENEGRECNRKHECSWCKENHKRSLPHQRSFCRQRINAGEQ